MGAEGLAVAADRRWASMPSAVSAEVVGGGRRSSQASRSGASATYPSTTSSPPLARWTARSTAWIEIPPAAATSARLAVHTRRPSLSSTESW